MSFMGLKSAATTSVLAFCIIHGVAQAGDTSDVLSNIDQLTPLSDTSLGVQNARGGSDGLNVDGLNLQVNNLQQNATLDHNSVHSSITGNNNISTGAFTGLTGFATVIQNSGNNVIIQNATIVNFASHQ